MNNATTGIRAPEIIVKFSFQWEEEKVEAEGELASIIRSTASLAVMGVRAP